MKLSTITVSDWEQFGITKNVFFHCPCDKCRDDGVVFPTSSTAYDTGYEVAGPVEQSPYPGVIGFHHHGHVWLGTRLNDGVDAAPYLAAAWLRMFPNSQWLPEQFGDVNSVPEFHAELPREDADAVVAKLRESLSMSLEKSKDDLKKLNQMCFNKS